MENPTTIPAEMKETSMPPPTDSTTTVETTMPVDLDSSKPAPYKPVVIVHGLMTGDVSTMDHLASRITQLHPGTRTYVIDRFCGLASLEPMWRQTHKLADDLLDICSMHPEGIHLIGYSQGGLIARGMLEEYGIEHNVKTFVSLSSPQGGQFGAECFTKMFPALTARSAYEVFYTRLGQHALSVANYWYDPRHRDLYLEYSAYLAVIDNLRPQLTVSESGTHRPEGFNDDEFSIDDCDVVSSSTSRSFEFGSSSNTRESVFSYNSDTPLGVRVAVAVAAVSAATEKVAEGHGTYDSDEHHLSIAVDTTTKDDVCDETDIKCADDSDDTEAKYNGKVRKLGIARLQRLVLIGGPDDGVISPWQSSHFGILDANGGLIPMRERKPDDIYSDLDPIGLRQLDNSGRLIEYTIPGVSHHEWHRNEQVLHECILKWLD